jgi:hypothetical protein
MVHLADPVGGGREQIIQEHYGCGHILVGPGKSRMWRTFVVDGGGDSFGSSSGESASRPLFGFWRIDDRQLEI